MILQIASFCLFLGFISLPTVQTLRKSHRKRELAAFAVLMGSALLIGSLLLAEVQLPSPAEGLRTLFQPIGELLYPPTAP